jgi:hypothetical protein
MDCLTDVLGESRFMATVGNIESVQRRIERQIGSVIGRRTVIKPQNNAWKKATRASRIAFDMFCDGIPSTAERKRGGRCPVFPVTPDASALIDQVWASWHEEWQCEKKGDFDLVGVGWTFFWGVDGRLSRETEIVRAEWDHVKHRGGFAAQPHWHIDTEMMVGFTRPRSTQPSVNEPADLVELPRPESDGLVEIGESLEIQGIDVSGMHFGMGGWEHHDTHPRCWQSALTTELTELVLWAERSLRSARDQFQELKAS